MPTNRDDYFLTVTGYPDADHALARHARQGEPAEKLKHGPTFFDAKGLDVSQHDAASKDGTASRISRSRRKDLKLDGTNPTLLYGYGGFEISLTPGYSPARRRGLAGKGRRLRRRQHPRRRRVRPAWHQAALKANRHTAYEDFAPSPRT